MLILAYKSCSGEVKEGVKATSHYFEFQAEGPFFCRWSGVMICGQNLIQYNMYNICFPPHKVTMV